MGTGVIEVSAGLVMRDGLLLITRRKSGSHLGGLWEFPGGKREPSESWEQCLVRELAEELAITVAVGPMRHETVHAYPGKTVHLRFFEAELLSGEPQAIDCAEVAWVHPGDLRRYEFPEADLGLVALLAG
ncbi:MAG: (deoxy)nucleoside triphosphate pyrophosphohydrolase [Verrucomicrobium sp.]|jgi:mutator protein MutT|nr:(deoxy)nucleoside triphosphate pyrophosphohydrolase [Verrucomicrobium sp.]